MKPGELGAPRRAAPIFPQTCFQAKMSEPLASQHELSLAPIWATSLPHSLTIQQTNMSRRKSKSPPIRKRSTEETLRALRGSLRTLRALNESYDSGNFDCARDICVVIDRIISCEAYRTGIRRNLIMPTYAHQLDPRNLHPQWPSGSDWNDEEHPEHFHFPNTISDAAIRCVSEEVLLGMAESGLELIDHAKASEK